VPVLLPLLALIAAGVWRFAPANAGWTASGLTLLVALILGRRFPAAARTALPALALLAALIAALRLIPGDAVWQCAVRCQGGGHYQELFHLSVLWPAVAALVAFAGLCLRDREAERLSAPTAALGWALVGASCYYLHLGWRLGLVCPHCLAVHTAVLACVGGLLRTLPAVPAAASAALAFLALHAAFHPGVVADSIDVDLADDPRATATVLSAANKLAFATADAVRRSGDATAPVVLELVLDLQCPVCARQHHELLATLAPALAAKRAELVVRHLVRRSEPGSQALGRWAFAAAMDGREAYEYYVGAMLGSRPGADARELRAHLAEAMDPLRLEVLADRHQAAIDRLLSQDAQRLIELKTPARTPQLIAVDRASGAVLRRWVGELPLGEIGEWLRK
jgi:hypothetical protein